jgi:hypothetical protein
MDRAIANPLANQPVVSRLDLGRGLQDSEALPDGRLTSRQSLFDLREDVGTQKAVRFSPGQDIAVVVAAALAGSHGSAELECTNLLMGEGIQTVGDFVDLDWEDFNTLSLTASQRSKLRKAKTSCEMEQASRKRALTISSSSQKKLTHRKVAGFWDQFSSLKISGLLPTMKVNGERQSDAYCRWVTFMDYVVYIDGPVNSIVWLFLFYHDSAVTRAMFGSSKMMVTYMVLRILYGPLMSAWLRANAKCALSPGGALWRSAEVLGIDESFKAAAFETAVHQATGIRIKITSPLRLLNSGVLLLAATGITVGLVVFIVTYTGLYAHSPTLPQTWWIFTFVWQLPLNILRIVEWYSDLMVMAQYSLLSTACLDEYRTRAAIVLEDAASSCSSSAGQMAHAHMLEELEDTYLKPCFGPRSSSWAKSALVYLIAALLCCINVITMLSLESQSTVTVDNVITFFFYQQMMFTAGYAVVIQFLVCRISDFGIGVLTDMQAPRASVGSAIIFGDASKYALYLDQAGLLVAKVAHFTYCSDNLLGGIATFILAMLIAAFSSHGVSLIGEIFDVPSSDVPSVSVLNSTNASLP